MALVDIAPMSFLLFLFLILVSGFGSKPRKHKSKVGAKQQSNKLNRSCLHSSCGDFSGAPACALQLRLIEMLAL